MRVSRLTVLALWSAVASAAEPAFVDVTARSGIDFRIANGARGAKHLYETMVGGAAWLDADGDGRLDLYLVQAHDDSQGAFGKGRQGNVLYRNLGGGSFEDVTAAAGVGDRGYGCGVATGDIDNDGDVDLYVTNVGPNVLYRNNGDGTFTDITSQSGVECPLWSTSAAFADVNADGLLDLYVANYLAYDPKVHVACTGNPNRVPGYCHPNKFDGAPDRLYVNRGGGRFEDVSRRAGVDVAGRILAKGLGVLPTDFDGDGRIDLFIANDSVPNFVWRNLGDLRFEDAGLETGMALSSDGKPEACMGIDGGDVNGDGRLDYFVTNFSEESDTLYLGEGDGFFLDGSARSGIATLTFKPLGFGTGLIDHDRDGDLDVFITHGHILDNITEISPGTSLTYRQTDLLLENDGRGAFRDISAAAGDWFQRPHVGRAAAFADFDDDGDVDIVVMSIDAPAVLLENRAAPENHWLGLALEGGGDCNRSAFGARVDVAITGRAASVPLEIRSAASYQSANDARRVVGLGRDGVAESVRVRWPCGRVETFGELRRDGYRRLVHGSGVEER